MRCLDWKGFPKKHSTFTEWNGLCADIIQTLYFSAHELLILLSFRMFWYSWREYWLCRLGATGSQWFEFVVILIILLVCRKYATAHFRNSTVVRCSPYYLIDLLYIDILGVSVVVLWHRTPPWALSLYLSQGFLCLLLDYQIKVNGSLPSLNGWKVMIKMYGKTKRYSLICLKCFP